MNDKLVTLFGGGGFVGRYVAQALLRAGARVRIAQRDPRQAFFLKPLGGLGQTQFVAADINRPATVERAVAGADAVVNLVGSFDADFAPGAGVVARAAAATGAETLLHVSAIGSDAESPAAYARWKAASEDAVREGFAGATILRPSTVFGREDQFVNRFAAMIEKAPLVPVVAGRTRFQPVFAGDVGDAVLAAVRAPAAHAGKTYELGGPDILTMAELLRWIAATIGRAGRGFVEVPDVAAALLARLPGGPITRDQWLLLQKDNVAAAGMPGLAALGVTPTPLAAVAPGWLVRFHRAGRFGRRAHDLAA